MRLVEALCIPVLRYKRTECSLTKISAFWQARFCQEPDKRQKKFRNFSGIFQDLIKVAILRWAHLTPKTMRKFLFLLAALLPIQPVLACETESEGEISTELEISALYPNPNSGEEEWIELTKLGDDPIDLSLYTLEDATAKPWTPSGTLEETVRLTGFSFQLNNSNETVTLKTKHGTVVDTWTYTTSTKGVILTRDAEDAEVETASETTATSTTTSTVTTTATPSKWPSFSEAMPNPEGSDSTNEWIELYNPYEESITLNGLYLDDSDGGSSPYALSGALAPESYLLIYVTESKLTLNNDSDHVRLLGVNDEILWDVVYSNPKEGESYAAFGSSHEWTQEPTPGSENRRSSSAEEDSEDSNSTTYQDGDLSDEVTITEVLPNPVGPDTEKEWIEITNASDESINLGNWTLDDGPGGSDPFVFPDDTILGPGETLVLYRTETGLALNNSDETVQLADYTGEIVSEIQYDTSVEGESYAEIQVEEVQSTQASA